MKSPIIRDTTLTCMKIEEVESIINGQRQQKLP